MTCVGFSKFHVLHYVAEGLGVGPFSCSYIQGMNLLNPQKAENLLAR